MGKVLTSVQLGRTGTGDLKESVGDLIRAHFLGMGIIFRRLS